MKHFTLFLSLSISLAAPHSLGAFESDKTLQTSSAAVIPPLLDRDKVIASARGITPEKYPDAETVLVSEHIVTEYQADGTFVTHDDEYIKILTEEGRRSSLEKEFFYNVFYGGCEIISAEVIKADGKIVSHDPKKISKEQIDNSQMEMNIYDPNDKIILAALPDVEIGDVIHFFVKKWESKPRMLGCYADWSVLEADVPIVQLTCEYIGPADKPLKSKALLSQIKGTVTATEKTEDGKIHYCWTARDVPQIFAEPEMPSINRVGQRLLVSTLGDWKEVSRWYYELSKPHLEKITPAIKAKTSALVAAAQNEEERVRAIFTFVSQEIRYMGITTEKGAPGYEPHDVDITFDNRYGVCRDKAALLAAMLHEAGIPAFPVLVMAGDKLDPEVPCASFNHAITAARMKNGSYMLMDSTNENAADLLPQYLNNKSFIVATPEGETLMTSPVSPVEDNMSTAKTTVKLADDGSATGTTVVDLKGINDVAYRGSLAEVKPDEAQRFFEGVLKSSLAGATLTHFQLQPENMQDTTRTIRITMDWSVPNILITGGDAAQLDLPFAGYSFGIVMRIISSSLDLDKRVYPLNTEYTCGVHEDLEISLPPSLTKPLSLPDYNNTEHKDFSIAQTIRVENSTLHSSLDLRLKSPEIAPADYLMLKQAMAKLQINTRQQPVFARKAATDPSPAASADVEIIDSRHAMVMEDASHWSTRQEVKKKILTYGGKKSNSELKFDFNPAWESVELEYAQVTQKDDTVRKIKPEEMNTFDAAWVASAPRYPGAKTLVVSLPGVEIGALVEYAVKRRIKDQPMFSSSYAVASNDAVKHVEFSYDFPESINPTLVTDLPPNENLSKETKNGRRRIRFHWNDIKPQIRENATPPPWVDAPDFAMSTGVWSDYAIQVGKKITPLTGKQNATAAKAAELVAGKSSPAEKITAIRDFVARQIRPTAPGFTSLPLDLAFTAADTTLVDGYGHSADRAILLFTLLKSAGFESELALAANGTNEASLRKRNLDIPSNGYFGSLVCRVKQPGTDTWVPLDLTSQYAPLGATYHDGPPGLPLDGQSFTWSAPADRKDHDDARIELEFDTEGTALIRFSKRFHGTAHADFVEKYSEMTPEERKRHFQALVSDIAQNAVAQGDLETNFDYPGTLRYSLKVEHYGVKTAKGFYFDLPAVPQQLVSANSSHRERALLIDGENISNCEWIITAPGGLKPVIQPESLDWNGPGNFGNVRFQSNAAQEKGKTMLHYKLDLHTGPVIVPTGNYKDLLEINRRFNQGSARRVLLE